MGSNKCKAFWAVSVNYGTFPKSNYIYERDEKIAARIYKKKYINCGRIMITTLYQPISIT